MPELTAVEEKSEMYRSRHQQKKTKAWYAKFGLEAGLDMLPSDPEESPLSSLSRDATFSSFVEAHGGLGCTPLPRTHRVISIPSGAAVCVCVFKYYFLNLVMPLSLQRPLRLNKKSKISTLSHCW